MKRNIIICVIWIIAVSMLLSGCTESTGYAGSTGYIVRDDITMDDMKYFYKGTEPINDHLTLENIMNALGLPHGMHENWRGDKEYNYSTEFGVLHFAENSGEDYYYIYADLNSDVETPESFGYDDVTIDSNKYKLDKRFDIDMDELDFINAETTASDLQEKLGAPHEMSYGIEGLPYIGVYIYEMNDGNLLKIAYGAHVVVYEAWIEAKDGTEIKSIVTRDS